MKQFMVEIELPDVLSEDFISLIPKQKRQVDSLMTEGKVYLYSLSFDRSRLWVGISAANEVEVWNILYTFPLIEYMNIDIHELAFHNTSKTGIFELSLN
jgi:muconolactone delta-isomerase